MTENVTIAAMVIPCVAEITAGPGDRLLVVDGKCVGLYAPSVAAPRPAPPAQPARAVAPATVSRRKYNKREHNQGPFAVESNVPMPTDDFITRGGRRWSTTGRKRNPLVPPDDEIIAVVREHGPLAVRQIADRMGIEGRDPARAPLVRRVATLTRAKVLARLPADKHVTFPRLVVGGKAAHRARYEAVADAIASVKAAEAHAP